MKKKLSLLLALAIMTAAGLYASGFNMKQTSTAGRLIVSNKPAVLQNVFIGNTTGDITVKVYDSATLATTSAQLMYTFAISGGVTQTAAGRTLALGGSFLKGVVISTDSQTNTLTATWQYNALNQ